MTGPAALRVLKRESKVFLNSPDWQFMGTLGPRFLFAFRLSASVSLALFVTYWLELQNSFWAATTAAIVCQPNLGASLQKGRYRVIGTIVGALAMVGLLSLFAQQRNTLIFSLSLWCGLCGCAVVVLRNYASYAAALSGITAAIIFADAIPDPTAAFFIAVTRVGEICIGIGAASVLILLTENGIAGRQTAEALNKTAAELWGGFLETLSPTKLDPDHIRLRRAMVRSFGSLRNQIDAAIGESSYLHSRRGNLDNMHSQLLKALVGWRNVDHLPTNEGEDLAVCKRLASEIFRALAPTDIRQNPIGFSERCTHAIQRLDSLPIVSPACRIVVDGASEVVSCLSAIAECEALLGRDGGTRKPSSISAPVLVDPIPVLIAGFRVFAAVLSSSIFWISTAWPVGQFAVVFSAIATLVFASFGDQARALAKDYAIGAASMAILGGLLYFAILPSLTWFSQLLLVLVCLYAAIGFMQAGKFHSVVFLAMSVCSLPLLGLGNPTTYDASNYFNLALAIVSGSTIGTLFFVVLPIMDPFVRARRLLIRALGDLRKLLLHYSSTAPARWIQLLSARLCALPPNATDSQFGDLVSLSAAARAAGRLIADLPTDRGGAVLQKAFESLAHGNLQQARKQLEHLDTFVGGTDFPASNDLRINIRAQLKILKDIIDDHAALFGLGSKPSASTLVERGV